MTTCVSCKDSKGEIIILQVRLQTMPIPGPNQLPLYSGTWDCAKKTVTKEGIRGLYKGIYIYVV